MPDLLGIILWPLKWAVELVLVAWHAIFTFIGLPAAAGITWVLAIVGLVVVVRAALIPLFVKQIKSQRKMMEIAPELRKIQDKYKGKKDQLSREAMSRETMALYKRNGTSPVSGCLPLLVQMPVFFSLYSTLSSIKANAEASVGGVGPLTPELTLEFYNAKLFGVASLHDTLVGAWQTQPEGWQVTVTILVILVVLMIASQFLTQLQIISKNLSPEAKTGQAYQMQRIMLYILPFAFVFSGVFFPLGVVIYWFTSNIWTMVQQFLVIRNLPTPGSEAAKLREERLARRGKAIDSSGKIISMDKYQAEQQRLLDEAERAKASAPKRQQPVGKQRAKKQVGPAKPQDSAKPANQSAPQSANPPAAKPSNQPNTKPANQPAAKSPNQPPAKVTNQTSSQTRPDSKRAGDATTGKPATS